MKTTKLTTTKLAVLAALALLAVGAVRSSAPAAHPAQAKITTAPQTQLADGTETRGGGKGKRSIA